MANSQPLDGKSLTTRLPIRVVPCVNGSSLAIMRRVLDLPHPEGPRVRQSAMLDREDERAHGLDAARIDLAYAMEVESRHVRSSSRTLPDRTRCQPSGDVPLGQ